MESANLVLPGTGLLVPGRERAARVGALDQRDLETVRIDERQRALAEAGLDRRRRDAVACQPLAPEAEAVRRDGERHLDARGRRPRRGGAMCAQGKNVRSVPGCPSASA